MITEGSVYRDRGKRGRARLESCFEKTNARQRRRWEARRRRAAAAAEGNGQQERAMGNGQQGVAWIDPRGGSG